MDSLDRLPPLVALPTVFASSLVEALLPARP
jgi:hypothetical protein